MLEQKPPRKKIELNAIIISTITPKVLTVIENVQKNSKKFVSIQLFVKIDSILFEIFSWQKIISFYFFFEFVQKNFCFRKKIIFCFRNFWNCFHIYIFENRLKSVTWINENHFVLICLFIHNFTNKCFKKNSQVRFVSSFVNFFDFFNTFVFSFSTFSISAQSIFFNHFSLKNFFKSSTILQNEERGENVYKNLSITRSEESDSNKTTNAEFSIKSKSRWKFKIFVKINNENEKIKSNNSNNSKNFSESNQSKNSNDVDLNLNFTRSKIQKLKNSQSLFSFSKHYFSSNTSQFFSNTSMNSNENEQNEIDENDFSFELNLFQQNIQNIALFMFNLFKNNIAFKKDNVSNNNFSNDD